MQERDLVNQIAEIAARLKRIERWQDQWRTRDRQVANLNADKVTASEGYLVAFGRGLCANRHVEHRPAFSNYSVGETVILASSQGPNTIVCCQFGGWFRLRWVTWNPWYALPHGSTLQSTGKI